MFSDRYSHECVIYNGSDIDDSLTVASYNKFHVQNKKATVFVICKFLDVFVFVYNSHQCNVYIIEHSTDF